MKYVLKINSKFRMKFFLKAFPKYLFFFIWITAGVISKAQLVSFQNRENNAQNPCISPQQYDIIEKECIENIKKYKINQPNKAKVNAVSLSWPLRPSPNLTDCSYYRISAYVDNDPTVGVIKDFNCGTNTYDGHSGTDIATWPYNFYKMDNNLVEVVAAAAGTIVNRHDGEFDRNCTSNNLTANYIIIQHNDGSYALYWHMKKNSVTSKTVNQTVVAGEYLGVVGSSGSASGPHLHFEVRTGSTAASKIDPYTHSCTSNNASWWAAQKSYKETSVVKVSVNATDLVFPGCPTTETSNESRLYQIPYQGIGLGAGYAKFYAFLRDQISGMVLDLRIENPDGSTFVSWTYTSISNTSPLTVGFSKLLPTLPGNYIFKGTYNGVTCSYPFKIYNCPSGNISLPQDDIGLLNIKSGSRTFNTQTISASNSIANLNTRVVFAAEKHILLLPNFKVDTNATFTASIAGCPN